MWAVALVVPGNLHSHIRPCAENRTYDSRIQNRTYDFPMMTVNPDQNRCDR